MSRLINTILNEEFEKTTNHSILKDPNKISLDYVPETLPCREKELTRLTYLFRDVITSFNTINYQSTMIFVIGDEKTGKTVTVKRFGIDIERFVHQKQFISKINFNYRHVNCIRYRTFYSIFISVIQSFVPEFPIRGFSTLELIKYLKEFLELSNSYLLLTLDDINALNNDKDYESVLSNLIMNEIESPANFKKRISVILIDKNSNKLETLTTYFPEEIKQVVLFSRYTSDQLLEILRHRATDTLLPQSWEEGDLLKIVSIVRTQNFNYNDPRLGLEILWRLARETERENKTKINMEEYSYSDLELLRDPRIELNLKIQEKVILFIIAEILLKNQNIGCTRIKEIKKVFDQMKMKMTIPFSKLGYTSIFNYLQDLKRLNLVQTQVANSQKRGRSTLIRLNVHPSYVNTLLKGQLMNQEKKNQ